MCIIAENNPSFFDQSQVEYLLKKLRGYRDLYTKRLRAVLKRYLKHRDFYTMHNDIHGIDRISDGRPFHQIWDMNARMSFLEIIHPVTN